MNISQDLSLIYANVVKSLKKQRKKNRIWEKNNWVKQVKQVKQFHRETAKQWNSCSEKRVKQWNSETAIFKMRVKQWNSETAIFAKILHSGSVRNKILISEPRKRLDELEAP